jgi:hypothetical protein
VLSVRGQPPNYFAQQGAILQLTLNLVSDICEEKKEDYRDIEFALRMASLRDKFH